MLDYTEEDIDGYKAYIKEARAAGVPPERFKKSVTVKETKKRIQAFVHNGGGYNVDLEVDRLFQRMITDEASVDNREPRWTVRGTSLSHQTEVKLYFFRELAHQPRLWEEFQSYDLALGKGVKAALARLKQVLTARFDMKFTLFVEGWNLPRLFDYARAYVDLTNGEFFLS